MPQTLDQLLAAAKNSLAGANALARSTGLPDDDTSPVPTPQADPGPFPGADVEPPSLWDRIKNFATHNALATAAQHFAEDVDPQSARDAKALAGTYGPLDTLKSFLAGAGSGYLNELGRRATPMGLAETAALGEGIDGAPRLATRLVGAVQAGRGISTAADPTESTSNRVVGGVNAALGGLMTLGGGGSEPGTTDSVFESNSNWDRTVAANRQFFRRAAARAGTSEPSSVSVEPITPRGLPEPQAALPPSMGTVDTLAEHDIPPSDTPPVASETPDDLPVSAAPGKPRISAQEFADILRSRAKFASDYPDTTLPPGSRDELDRMGLEYRRTQGALNDLKAAPDADPTNLAQMNQGARELGTRLSKLKRLLTTPPPAPGREGHFTLPEANVPDAVYNKIREAKGIAPSPLAVDGSSALAYAPEQGAVSFNPDEAVTDASGRVIAPPQGAEPARPAGPWDANGERGAIDPRLAAQIGLHAVGGVGGAAAGNQIGQRTGHSTRDTVLGALVGGALPALLTPEGRQTLLTLRNSGMISGPTTLLKKTLGDAGSIGAEALEGSIGKMDPEYGARLLKSFLSPETLDVAKQSFNDTEESAHGAADYVNGPVIARGPLSIPSRALNAVTVATQDAAQRAGLSVPESRNLTNIGTPKTELGQWLTSRPQSAKWLLPMVKVATNLAERGAARTPIGSLYRLLNTPDLSPELTRRIVTQGVLGTGAIAAGAALHDPNSKAKTALEAALLGPYAVPYEIGAITRDAFANPRRTTTQDIYDAAGHANDVLPLPEVRQPSEEVASIFAPRALADVAQLLDYPRDRATNQDFFDRLAARIPGLREGLPYKKPAKPLP